MALALRLCRLPRSLRAAVDRAIRDPGACEGAIAAIERHMADTARTPECLIALAALTYREAEALVLSQIESASQQALSLIDEALALGAARTNEIDALQACCLTSIATERAREAKIVGRLAKGIAKKRDVVELAHRMISGGDDDELAMELLRRAS